MPVEMSRERFEELVSEALDEVPAEFAKAMDNVVVLVEEFNDEAPDILGLYHGRPRARAFRRHLSEWAPREGAGVEVLREAIRIAEGESTPALAAAE